eukprot:CAMPEP_0173101258 /NCGR_PEP_ID=MMETSP1102-20130122/36722_1 /TAXON_ID=49646 /ORGANISM="Geminigera sp., Strain Caron Lab Isolate" /LENGTH=97 /DNA_ID=CAMNT_0013994917 /DNA_START=1010 /DNA_END=1300 /DNA_ORIENTATION=+
MTSYSKPCISGPCSASSSVILDSVRKEQQVRALCQGHHADQYEYHILALTLVPQHEGAQLGFGHSANPPANDLAIVVVIASAMLYSTMASEITFALS